jgi:hypothetical protein
MDERHDRLTLISISPLRSASNHKVGLWLCDCGNEKSIALTRVRNGYSRSCGCLAVEAASRANKRHGMRGSPEYSSWSAMKARCLDPGNKDYPRWGGVGITIHQEWIDSFEAFYRDVGPRPKGTSLDRIKAELGYRPGNVRWATPAEQARNRRDLVIVNTSHGQMPLVDYANIVGITAGAAHLRLKRGKLEGACHV